MRCGQAICFQRIGRWIVLLCFFAAVSAHAHEPSKSYLSLTLGPSQINGRLDVSIRDLQTALPPAAGQNDSAARDQLDPHSQAVTAYVLSHLQIALDGHLVAPRFTSNTTEEFSEGQYLQLDFVLGPFSSPRTIAINYRLFFETNSLHRGLFRLEAGGKTQMAAFSPTHPSQQFEAGAVPSGRPFLVFLREGIWHIWTGYDHILFLLALLLPSVLRREDGQWREVRALRPAFYNVLQIVSAFTIAHSLTLSLAVFGIVRLPPRFTESAIALSVMLAAANNLWPLVRERGWIVAFAFGLIHGFGFATALSDFGLVPEQLALTLVAFNLGVEIGQLAIVAAFLPIAFALRRTWFYQTPLLRFGSAFVILIAGAWCMERVLDLKLVPF
jgi:hypothetical protein